MKWQERLFMVISYIALEIILNLVGIDELVDCSEFIFLLADSQLFDKTIE
ncbi:hypothetical protein CWATWH0402_2371 [Crocosphaera watsonii WH 0402]|uniref:Uncharacterized protein n=1 Tax=Crocosphaera watsonii WH 0402 TaxID=1284629 RepID=T2JNR7_CROWT|nr:hypothetical protein CWATWH0402_2371 [Crocosphaera watsonii WH 0402]